MDEESGKKFLSKSFLLDPQVNLSCPDPGRIEKSNFSFSHFIFSASKGFSKALKAFIKPFEAPQRSLKIKTYVNFVLIQLPEMHGARKVNQ